MMTDALLIRGGRVLDPSMDLDGPMEVLIRDGRIVDLQETIPVSEGVEILDASEKLVTPGFIDLHTHVARDLVSLAVEPDHAGVDSGVTTVCDAGSVGWVNFSPFDKFIVSAAHTRVLSFLHLAPFGEALMPEIGYDVVNEAALQAVLRQHGDVICGVKLRLVEEVVMERSVDIIGLGVRMAREAGLPIMVHIGMSPDVQIPPEVINTATKKLLDRLEAGDVITHAFTDKPGSIFNMHGEPVRGLESALNRGVFLDAAPGRGHLHFDLARAAISQGFRPSALGTDVVQIEDDQPHFFNVAAVMSKFMALGLTLAEVVAAVTNLPAQIVNIVDETGSLAVGKVADLSISELHNGEFLFHDGRAMNTISGSAYLSPQVCIRKGRVFPVRKNLREHIPTPDAFQAYMQAELEKIQRRRQKS